MSVIIPQIFCCSSNANNPRNTFDLFIISLKQNKYDETATLVSESTIDSYVCKLDSVLYCFLSNPFTRTSLDDTFNNIYNISINDYLSLNKYEKFSFILQYSLEPFVEDFDYSYTSQKIKEDSASIIIYHNGNSEKYYFIRENNIWKIIW